MVAFIPDLNITPYVQMTAKHFNASPSLLSESYHKELVVVPNSNNISYLDFIFDKIEDEHPLEVFIFGYAALHYLKRQKLAINMHRQNQSRVGAILNGTKINQAQPRHPDFWKLGEIYSTVTLPNVEIHEVGNFEVLASSTSSSRKQWLSGNKGTGTPIILRDQNITCCIQIPETMIHRIGSCIESEFGYEVGDLITNLILERKTKSDERFILI